MNVYLSNGGDQLPTDVVIDWVSRSDLTPIPRNLEFTVKLIDGVEKRIKRGVTVWSGRENLAYTVVKTDKAQPLGEIQGKSQQQAMRVTALLESCAPLSQPLSNAVIASNASFAGVLRSCGAFLRMGSDFPVSRFTCFKGQIPSYAIARALQKEGAAMVLVNGMLKIMRLTDIAKQPPIDDIGQIDSSAKVESEFLQLQEVPSYFSVGDDGAIITGQMGQSRVIEYMPRGSARELRNASCVLVRNKTVDSQQCQQIQAGNVLRVAAENFVVITAAHAARQKNGAMDSYSRLWLGSIVNAV